MPRSHYGPQPRSIMALCIVCGLEWPGSEAVGTVLQPGLYEQGVAGSHPRIRWAVHQQALGPGCESDGSRREPFPLMTCQYAGCERRVQAIAYGVKLCMVCLRRWESASSSLDRSLLMTTVGVVRSYPLGSASTRREQASVKMVPHA